MRVTAIVLLSAAGFGIGRQEAPTHVLGCYDVEEGAWVADTSREYPISARAPSFTRDSVHSQIPPRIELTAAPALRSRGGWWSIVVPPDALPTPQRFNAWRTIGDTLRLNLTRGFGGIDVSLSASPAGWSGTVRKYSDNFGTQEFIRPVELRRVDCGSPPPVPSDVMPVVLRSIQLEGGYSITLGEPLPAGLDTTSRRSGAVTVHARLEDAFPAPDTVLVMPDRLLGVVGGIELKWVEPVAPAMIMEPLIAVMGEPHAPGFTRWQNRLTRIYLYESEQGVRRIRLTDPRHR